jgi:cytochrome b6-f complex iron-sulfur subunit
VKIERRGFLQILGGLCGSFALLPQKWARAQAKKMAIPLAKVEKLTHVGGWAVLKLGADLKIMFVRETETSVKALTSICTHKQCDLQYKPDNKNVECTCHHSTFNLDGKVLVGPATENLKTYPASLSGDKIIVEV